MATLGEATVEIVADTSALDDLSSAVQGSLADVSDQFDGVSDAAAGSAEGVVEAFAVGADGTVEAFAGASDGVAESLDGIVDAGDVAAEGVGEAFDGVGDEIADGFEDAADATVDAFDGLGDAAGDAADEIADAADGAVDAFDEVADAAGDAAEEIADVGDSAESLDEVGESADAAGDDLDGFGDAASDAASEAESGFSSLIEVFAGLSIATMAVDTAKSILQGTISGLITSTADYGDEIAKTSVRLGVAEDDLQGLRFAGELAGIATSDMESALRRMNLQLGDAALSGGTAAERFSDLGVSIHDTEGNLRSTGDVFVDVIDSVSELGSTAEQSARLGEIFGRRYGTELLTLLDEGGEGIREQMELLADLGGIMDEDATAASERFNDQLLIMRMAFSGLRRRAMAPLIEMMADSLIPRIVDGIIAFGDFVGELQEAETVGERLRLAWERIGPAVGEALSGIRDAAIEQVGRAAEWLSDGGAETIATTILGWRTQVMSAITGAFESMTEALQESGPEITSDAVGKLATPLREAIVELSDDALAGFVEMLGAAMDFRDELKPHMDAAAAIILEELSRALLDLAPSIGDALGRMLAVGVELSDPVGSLLGFGDETESALAGEILPAIGRVTAAVVTGGVTMIGSFAAAVVPNEEHRKKIDTAMDEHIIPGFERMNREIDKILTAFAEDGWSGMWEAVTDVWSTIGQVVLASVEERFPEAMETARNAVTTVQDAWDTFTTALQEAWDTYGAPVVAEIQRRFNQMRTSLTNGWRRVQRAWETLMDTIDNVWHNYGRPVVLDIIRRYERMRERLSDTWQAITRIVETAMGVISNIIETVMSIISGDWRREHDDMDRQSSSTWDSIRRIVDTATGGLLSTITGFLSETLSSWRSTWSDAESRVREAWDTFRSTIESRANTVITFMRGLPGRMRDALFAAIAMMRERGREIIQGIRDGMGERVERVLGFLSGLPGRMRRQIPNPLGVLRGVGRQIMQGLWNGMLSVWSSISGWLSSLGGRIASLKGPLSADRVLLTDQGRAIMEGLGAGMQAGFAGVEHDLREQTAAIAGVWDAAAEGVSGSEVAAPWRQVATSTRRGTDALMLHLRDYLGGLTGRWDTAYRQIETVADATLAGLVDGHVSAYRRIVVVTADAFEALRREWDRGRDDAAEGAEGLRDAAVDALSTLPRDFAEIARDAIRAMQDELDGARLRPPDIPSPVPSPGEPTPGDPSPRPPFPQPFDPIIEPLPGESVVRPISDYEGPGFSRSSSVTVNVSGASQDVSADRIATLIRRSQTLEGTR